MFILERMRQVDDLPPRWLLALSSSMKRNCKLHQALSHFVVDGTIPKLLLGYQDGAVLQNYF
ncbi:hypothetical protein NEUTE1DRAFT_116997 [Neurospora tetrasperma FGSC 2508]|uniref:Uncharacterized protein n=2 Tax=Neurospora TaxID=5140 RepID=A0AAJ0IAN1_9PEZI|nr:uncharacterized protein NEUTE1DRAFT_116997 [Neurospora tetrasperma FGSC 2508]EGO57931.1 hypothetical protein NEUTE1DRAFT_116997 [Neurospora tetrasperma FGSC 2508]EGZ71777.1 hypothetical protein NEUTE2DRAFT_144611 [Neurospora tetrasperma FGSC 2509]KAK3494830.1 hypothetical protein B0T23DRAFT_119038 [Neurospora hispaniola]